jgi:GTPase SAR1 family protein
MIFDGAMICRQQINSCSWSPNGRDFALLGMDGSLTICTEGNSDRIVEIDAEDFRWSPSGQLIAAVRGKSASVWFVSDGAMQDQCSYPDIITGISWSPAGDFLAISFATGGVEIVDPETFATVAWGQFHDGSVALEWGPTGTLFSASFNSLVFWEMSDLQENYRQNKFNDGSEKETNWLGESREFTAAIASPHDGWEINDMLALPNGRLVTTGGDCTLRLWSQEGILERVYENPSGDTFSGLSTTSSGEFIVTVEGDGSILIIEAITFAPLGSVESAAITPWPDLFPGVRPGTNTLAGVSVSRSKVHFFDLSRLVNMGDTEKIGLYRNAKVVLVGDSGVGKSGLALVLSGNTFTPTESTHARNVWTLKDSKFANSGNSNEEREVLLWDLAGQPGYRLFHRLSLRDVSVGVIVFDSRSESDPFRGVPYWAKALDDAPSTVSPRKILVAARSDRGGLSVSSGRLAEFMQKYDISAFYETSAKSGAGLGDLIHSISQSIPWDSLPIVSAPRVFSDIRQLLVDTKRAGVLLLTAIEVEKMFAEADPLSEATSEMVDACLGRLEATGLISRISFGNRWLLQPELLDSYVAWLAHSARQEPDGMGSITETRALRGDYDHEALEPAGDEQAMLVTAVEEVVGRGLAFRVPTENGAMIVFPSELKADLPDYPNAYSQEVIFRFVGPIAAIYASMTVKLINSLGFGRDYKLFKNSAIFGYGSDSLCGYAVKYLDGQDDTLGQIVVFFGTSTSPDRKLAFLRYIDSQLGVLALADSVTRERIYNCYQCNYQMPLDVVALRLRLGKETLVCPVCDMHMPMDDLTEDLAVKDKRTAKLIMNAGHEQARQQRLAGYSSREEMRQFHVFICYNSIDFQIVRQLNLRLQQQGVITWLDSDRVKPGDTHTEKVESAIDSIPCAIVAVGPNSLGPWQEQEYYALLQKAVSKRKKGSQLRIIPVLLAGSAGLDEVPPFLGTRSVIDLRGHDSGGSGLRLLVNAIIAPLRSQQHLG